MSERAKKYQTFHANLLKEFQVCQEPVYNSVHAVQDEEVSKKFFPASTGESSPVNLSHLSASQRKDVVALLDRELFRETPGFTILVQHKIQLKKDAPVGQKRYRIPE